MFITAFFIIVKNCKKTNCPSMVEWVNCGICTQQNTTQWWERANVTVHNRMNLTNNLSGRKYHTENILYDSISMKFKQTKWVHDNRSKVGSTFGTSDREMAPNDFFFLGLGSDYVGAVTLWSFKLCTYDLHTFLCYTSIKKLTKKSLLDWHHLCY